jgi:enolase-phosphatase E1
VIEIHDVRAVVTDIEGTTTSLDFVQEVLFPYARQSMAEYVRTHGSQIGDITAETAAIVGRSDLEARELTQILLRWMDEDRKVTPLKTLQGRIWRMGYESGQLQGHVYDDAVRALRGWHESGLRLYIYSSGSIEAQKLLFSHTQHGDLTPLFSGYFDTTTGPKQQPSSYERIADSLALAASSIVFLSDHAGELRAAASAGMQTVLVARERPSGANEPFAADFEDVALYVTP